MPAASKGQSFLVQGRGGPYIRSSGGVSGEIRSGDAGAGGSDHGTCTYGLCDIATE